MGAEPHVTMAFAQPTGKLLRLIEQLGRPYPLEGPWYGVSCGNSTAEHEMVLLYGYLHCRRERERHTVFLSRPAHLINTKYEHEFRAYQRMIS